MNQKEIKKEIFILLKKNLFIKENWQEYLKQVNQIFVEQSRILKKKIF